MLFKHLSLYAGLTTCALFSQIAFGYNLEASLDLSKNEEAQDPAYSGQITYFFSPVNHGTSTPWAEVTFTERISFLQGHANYDRQSHSVDINYYGETNFAPVELKVKRTSYGANYTFRNPNSPHSFSALFDYSKIKFDNITTAPWRRWIPGESGYAPGENSYTINTNSQDIYSYGAAYDYYLQHNWTLGVAAGITDSDGPDSYTVGIHTNRLWNLGNNKWAGVKAAITRNEIDGYSSDNWLYELEGRYYFNERTGFSLGIEIPDDGYSKIFSVAFHRYLTKQLSLNVGYDYTKLDYPSYAVQPNGGTLDDTNTNFRARLSLRF
ncbi:hypothetical protein VDG1235_880 [Verrucomicrobiia bacterium DG1235]|nr:hypothetical protein VDG1235_880 [Verrucomicrobiae bacterium DG1235]